MRRLIDRIPRDKSLLLLLAPLVVIVATVLAMTMDDSSGSEARTAARKATTTTSAPGDAYAPLAATGVSASDSTADESLQFSDSSFDDGPTTASSGSGSDLGPATGYSGGGSSARRDAVLGSDTSTEGASVDPTPVDPAAGAVPTGASTTAAPATTTSVPAATTTTVPMPPPALSESPITALIPVSGVVVAGLGILWVARRRRRRTGR